MQDEVLRLQDAAAEDGDLRHPRPRRGAEARRPDRDHEGRPLRPGRHAGGDRRSSCRRLRPRVRARRPARQGPDGLVRAPSPRTGEGRRGSVVRHDAALGELLPVVFGARGPIGVVDAEASSSGSSTAAWSSTSSPAARADRPGGAGPRAARARDAVSEAPVSASSLTPSVPRCGRRIRLGAFGRYALPAAAASPSARRRDRERLPQRLSDELGARRSRAGSTASTTGSPTTSSRTSSCTTCRRPRRAS